MCELVMIDDREKKIKTKFGVARLNANGYYVITSSKEGNNMKLFHRLIYCNYHNCSLKDIEGMHIHHKDGNKINNCIMNLELIDAKEHVSLHSKGENNPFYGKKGEAHGFYGKHHSDKTKRHLSKCRNTSGYRRVYKVKSKKYSQGFIWCYKYYDQRKHKSIQRVNIDDLKKEVLARGLIWEEY